MTYSLVQVVPALYSSRLVESAVAQVACDLVYRARSSLPRVILLSHALNYKRVWRGRREGLAEVISIHEALTNQITVQNPCHG